MYQYATAYAAAVAASRGILAGDEGACAGYLGVLRSGSSRYPVDTLALAGVDVRRPEIVAEVYRLFGDLLDDIDDILDGKDS